VVERQLRRAATRRLAAEIALAEATGALVRVLCPGSADLVAMGGNVMDLARRTAVFETSLRTSAAALADLPGRARQPVRPTLPTSTRTTTPTLPRTPRPVAGTGRTEPQTGTRPVPTPPTTIPASPITRPSGVAPARGRDVREEPDLAG